MNIVALLTAKGNNTLSRKNLLPVAGLPLLWYPASAAKKSELITHYYASSDDNDILTITSELGYTPRVCDAKFTARGYNSSRITSNATR